MNLLKNLLTYLYDNEDQAGHSGPDKMDRPSFPDDRSVIDSGPDNDDDETTLCRDRGGPELLDRTTLPRTDDLKGQ